MSNFIFTIGHSNHALENFLQLLENSKIRVVVDVRSSPFSRHVSHFNRDQIEKALTKKEIKYIYLGQELGGRSSDPADYVGGQIEYKSLASRQTYKTAIQKLVTEMNKAFTTLMCSEKDPLECHRTLLIAQTLSQQNIQVSHIHADGTLENHGDALDRLMQIHNLSEPDLFSTDQERLMRALVMQEKKIAFRMSDISLGETSSL